MTDIGYVAREGGPAPDSSDLNVVLYLALSPGLPWLVYASIKRDLES